MYQGRTASIAIAMVMLTAGCQSAAVSPSSEATVSQTPLSASIHPSSTIDPAWITRPALTCGDAGRLFPPEALTGLGLAELGLDPAVGVLRATIADTPDHFPDSGWHRVIDDPDGVTFVAAGNEETPWFEVTVGLFDDTLQATQYGQCTLAIAAPDAVNFARWWLDPNAPPPTAEATELAILIRERECASGKPPVGRILAPTIVTTPVAFEIVIGVFKQSTAQDCISNPSHPIELELPEAIGSRGLFDASRYPPRPVTTEDPG